MFLNSLFSISRFVFREHSGNGIVKFSTPTPTSQKFPLTSQIICSIFQVRLNRSIRSKHLRSALLTVHFSLEICQHEGANSPTRIIPMSITIKRDSGCDVAMFLNNDLPLSGSTRQNEPSAFSFQFISTIFFFLPSNFFPEK